MKKCDPLGVTFFGVALFRVGDWQGGRVCWSGVGGRLVEVEVRVMGLVKLV